MSGARRCDPEVIFELADGALGPERAREIRDHLEACPDCRELYEKELELSAFLGSLELAEPRSVCPGVAMALPTRPLKARLLWATLALALLLVAAGPVLLAALAVGALLDLSLAAALLWMTRRRARAA